MQTIRKLIRSAPLVIAFTLAGCKKDNYQANFEPIAMAGEDQVVFLPIDSAELDGRMSRDIDGQIVNYQWFEVEGPAICKIDNPGAAFTKARNLTVGRPYRFRLSVTDNKSTSSFDDIIIKVIDLPRGTDTSYTDGTNTIYEFYDVPQGPVFEELDMFFRESKISLPGITNIKSVLVKWNNSMDWEEVCHKSCTIIDRFATFYNEVVHVYLRADPTYTTGGAGDAIAIKIVI